MSLQKKIEDGKQKAIQKLLRYLRNHDDPKVVDLLNVIDDFDRLLKIATEVEAS